MSYQLVNTDAEFAEVLAALRDEPAYAVDTEFHREKTFYPKLGLVQIAWNGGLALIDPLAVDISGFAEILAGDSVAVFHACDQDLEILELTCGVVPRRLFDTQIAAGFIGMSMPSLGSLYERVLGLKVNKGDRLTDWLARPLQDAQLVYAAGDVDRLLDVYDILVTDLTERGRLDWALDECERTRVRQRGALDPDQAWRKLKEIRPLRGAPRRVAQSLAAWRQERAAEIDQPVRFIMPDLAIVGIAQRQPTTVGELRKVRGLDDRHLRSGQAEAVLAVVAEGMSHVAEAVERTESKEIDRDLRPAVALVSAWVSQLGRNLEIDPTLLGTRNDIEALLRQDPDARLSVGWRSELVGEPIARLIDGEAALAFAGQGELVIETRSRMPLT